MKTAAVKSNKQNESRAAAHSIAQQKNNPKGTLALADNQSEPEIDPMKDVPKGQAGASKFIRSSPQTPVSLVSQIKNNRRGHPHFVDNRPEAKAQKSLQRKMNKRAQPTTPRQFTLRKINNTDKNANSTTKKHTIQRVVINTGDADLVTELSKDKGWIIASDIEVALKEGGQDQDIFELNAVPGSYVLPADENIYLVGHGMPGYLGNELPKDVAPSLNRIIPKDYKGFVRSLSCLAGFGGVSSGIVGLARLLVEKTIVKGADGVALNHPAYEGGSRVIPLKDWSKASPIVDKHIQAVHDKWKKYVQDTGIIPELFKYDTYYAELISDQFYKDLEVELEDKKLLLPKGSDIQVI